MTTGGLWQGDQNIGRFSKSGKLDDLKNGRRAGTIQNEKEEIIDSYFTMIGIGFPYIKFLKRLKDPPRHQPLQLLNQQILTRNQIFRY